MQLKVMCMVYDCSDQDTMVMRVVKVKREIHQKQWLYVSSKVRVVLSLSGCFFHLCIYKGSTEEKVDSTER